MRRSPCLVGVALVLVLFSGCGGEQREEVARSAPGGLAERCGVDPAQWRAALAATDASSSSESASVQTALDLIDSDCLTGASRRDVMDLLGGDGTVYYLGAPPFALDGETLQLGYDGDRVTTVRTVQG